MITRFLNLACLLGALGVFAVGANAQSGIAKATVPFEFAAGGAMMPAGDYTVDVPDFSGVLFLHGLAKNGSAGNSVALFSTFSGAISGTSSAKLIFERRNGMVYLSAVEWPGETAQVMSVFKHVTKGAVAAKLR
jgi:hypothetical protein